ncbi:MAG: SRPBCC family protein [Myxococcales bacterium]|nr:SRPBCC family protein [Myxococcales bacterium]MCB9579567.1 SRPBCC family protein [Polyangiaceae bacterium]
MAEREFLAKVHRVFAAPPKVVWALVADSNRTDRAMGLKPPQYEMKASGDGKPSTVVGHAKELGFEVRWVEPPYEWVEGRTLHGERRFEKGPVSRGGLRVRIEPTAGGSRVEVESYVAASGALARLVGLKLRSDMRASLNRYLDQLETLLAGRALDEFSGDEPPASAVRRLLMNASASPTISGVASRTDASELSFRQRRYDKTPVSAELRARVVDLLAHRPDEEVNRIRPYELARVWGLPRRDVLTAFLHAARAGLVDLKWQLDCPTCRVAAGSTATMASVQPRDHCDFCDVDFAVDFAENVEAVFQVNPAIRKVGSPVYCASSPTLRPHVFAQFRLSPRERREISADLPQGRLLARVVSSPHRAEIEVKRPHRVDFRLTASGLTAEQQGEGAEHTALTAVNDTESDALLVIERSTFEPDAVLGRDMATVPDFLDLFSAEAPAAGVDLSVASLTLLFTDLTDSTALYERLGDAKAFAFVEDHFRTLGHVVVAHDGAIVKTMGDAVMAAFPSAVRAVDAAIEMVQRMNQRHGDVGASLKVGLHEGPCLMVRANERLDFFGTTVNRAARLQAKAGAGQVVLMESLLEHPDIRERVAHGGFALHPFEAELKGFSEMHRLVALDVAPG